MGRSTRGDTPRSGTHHGSRAPGHRERRSPAMKVLAIYAINQHLFECCRRGVAPVPPRPRGAPARRRRSPAARLAAVRATVARPTDASPARAPSPRRPPPGPERPPGRPALLPGTAASPGRDPGPEPPPRRRPSDLQGRASWRLRRLAAASPGHALASALRAGLRASRSPPARSRRVSTSRSVAASGSSDRQVAAGTTASGHRGQEAAEAAAVRGQERGRGGPRDRRADGGRQRGRGVRLEADGAEPRVRGERRPGAARGRPGTSVGMSPATTRTTSGAGPPEVAGTRGEGVEAGREAGERAQVRDGVPGEDDLRRETRRAASGAGASGAEDHARRGRRRLATAASACSRTRAPAEVRGELVAPEPATTRRRRGRSRPASRGAAPSGRRVAARDATRRPARRPARRRAAGRRGLACIRAIVLGPSTWPASVRRSSPRRSRSSRITST